MTNDDIPPRPAAEVRRFPQSKVPPRRTPGGFVELGITPLARQLGLQEDQLGGHWCSRCEGIWYGYTLEAECPRCGNRRG
ncbi:MAG TPA: hypothetical protein VLI72_15135 [Methylibium sp.]|nr:hypothetical protein [Methylibium sp.]